MPYFRDISIIETLAKEREEDDFKNIMTWEKFYLWSSSIIDQYSYHNSIFFQIEFFLNKTKNLSYLLNIQAIGRKAYFKVN